MKKKYNKGELTVEWNPDLCVHSGKCVHGLPDVFKPKEQPWIQLENATARQIVEVVRQCPSGALSIVGEQSAKPEEENVVIPISFIENGPIILNGKFLLAYKGTTSSPKGTRVALCRCGASANKPFCDGAHQKTDFKG